MIKPKTLYFDIETTPCTAFLWGTGKQHVNYNQIGKEWVVICVSYMWDTDKKPKTISFNVNKYNLNKFDDESDKSLLIEFSKIYNQAEVVVAHNGSRFDIPKLRARLVKYGLPDLHPTIVSDSYMKSRSIKFTSHKLDSLGKFLKIGRKSETGLDLWLKVINKDPKALKYMINYCEQDVSLLKDLYIKLTPYIKPSVNLALYNNRPKSCISCGSERVLSQGQRMSSSGLKYKWGCKDCGRWMTTGEKVIKNTKEFMR